MRPSRLHTTTLCVSSDINAANRDFSCSMPCAASRTLALMSARRVSRWRTSWLISSVKARVSRLPSCGKSRATSDVRNTCACSTNWAEGSTQ